MMGNRDKSILLFDGVCNLCNGFVQFVIKRDPAEQFVFGALQSEIGQSLLEQHQLPKNLSTVVLIHQGKAYTQSDVALETGRILGGGWQAFYVFKWILPAFLRNAIYDWLARNRYRLFGKSEQCMVPTPELKARFL